MHLHMFTTSNGRRDWEADQAFFFGRGHPAKPISLVERCWCRSTRNTVPQRSIKELKFLHTPNCPFQVM
ncbi:hypothetical protein CRUP_019857 [Coryphaenoides rupestris]|nr:hypothetical protein CRUP_019857 [Coryphaenoides rupestris]